MKKLRKIVPAEALFMDCPLGRVNGLTLAFQPLSILVTPDGKGRWLETSGMILTLFVDRPHRWLVNALATDALPERLRQASDCSGALELRPEGANYCCIFPAGRWLPEIGCCRTAEKRLYRLAFELEPGSGGGYLRVGEVGAGGKGAF